MCWLFAATRVDRGSLVAVAGRAVVLAVACSEKGKVVLVVTLQIVRSCCAVKLPFTLPIAISKKCLAKDAKIAKKNKKLFHFAPFAAVARFFFS